MAREPGSGPRRLPPPCGWRPARGLSPGRRRKAARGRLPSARTPPATRICTRLRPLGRRPRRLTPSKTGAPTGPRRRLVKLLHPPVQTPAQRRHRLRTPLLAGEDGHHWAHLPRAATAQKRLPDQQPHFLGPPLKPLQPRRQEALPPVWAIRKRIVPNRVTKSRS